MIEGLVFDKDGTLFDFRASWGGWVRKVVAGLARDDAHAGAMSSAIGFDLASGSFAPDSPVIAATAHDIAECLLPHLPDWSHGGLSGHLNALAAHAEMAPAVPLRPLFEGLRARGLRIGLATNDAEAAAHAHLARQGISDLFDFVAGYDSGHGPKPGPGMCRAFLRSTGLRAEACAMVGDSLHDLEAGRSAGLHTVAVLTGIATEADLAPHADAVLPDIGALPGWLDR